MFEGDGRNLEVELRCSLDRKDFYLNGKKIQMNRISSYRIQAIQQERVIKGYIY